MSTVGQYQPLIARDELVACLDRMTARKVTMISAPVGSGKTSLLRAWAERPDRDRRLAVVQVRRDQHDAQPFWLDLLAAVRQAFGTTHGEPPTATPDFNGRAMVDRVLIDSPSTVVASSSLSTMLRTGLDRRRPSRAC
jgi:LuxR family maltose regulon positive regulatory protein